MPVRRRGQSDGRQGLKTDRPEQLQSAHESPEPSRCGARDPWESIRADFQALLDGIYSGASQSVVNRVAKQLNRDFSQSGTTRIHQGTEFALPEGATTDHSLVLTLKVFKTATGVSSPALARTLATAGKFALRQHCAFRNGIVRICLDNSVDQSRDKDALEILTQQDYSALSWSTEVQGPSQNQIKQCRQNAPICMIHWLSTARNLALEDVYSYLHTYVWNAYPEPRARTKRVSLLLNATASSSRVASVVSSLLNKRNDALHQAHSDQHRRLRTVEAKAKRSDDELFHLRRDLDGERAIREGLERDLSAEKEEHSTTRVHLLDDYERLRSRLSRELGSASSLLADSLSALDREPPKVKIVEHHLRLVVEALQGEIERLNKGTKK